MSENKFRYVDVFDAGIVTSDLWAQMREMHATQLRGLLPTDSEQRVIDITGTPDEKGLEDYSRPMIDPSIRVGDGLNPNQMFKDPRLVVTRDLQGEIQAILASADNTSGGRAARNLKMALTQGLHLPGRMEKINPSNRRALRLGTLVVSETAELMEVDSELWVPLAALYGLYGLIKDEPKRNSDRPVTAYVMPSDPADTAMTEITKALGMQVQSTGLNTGNNGYTLGGEVDTMVSTVGDIRKRLKELGVPDKDKGTTIVAHRTKKSIKQNPGFDKTLDEWFPLPPYQK